MHYLFHTLVTCRCNKADKIVTVLFLGLLQVFKFGPDLNPNPLLVIGEKFVPGSDEKHFCKPTHVVVLRSGEFFVADG